jgi:hypothetical protein
MSTPRPLTSAYRVTPWAELGLGDTRVPAGSARWDVSRWDDPAAAWAGTEPSWLDVACEVITGTSKAGRNRVIERFTVGSAAVTLRNVDGWADLAGPPIPPAALPLRPGRQFRFGVDTPSGRHVLHRGYIDDARPQYVPSGTDVVECQTIDALGEVGRMMLDAVDPAVGAGDTASGRTHRLLDAAGWPAGYRDVHATSIVVQPTTYGGRMVDLLGVTADSAAGSVFGDLAGRVAFRPRDWQTYVPDAPPAAIVGNVGPGDVCPQSWEMSFRRADVAGMVRLGRPDGTGVTVTAPYDTLAAIGPEPFERTDLITVDDDDLTTLANRYLTTRGIDTMPRVEAVTLAAWNDPGDGSVVELMATARPETPTRIRCRLAESGRIVFDRDMFVTDVTHDIDEAGHWTCRLGLDVAAPFAAAGGRWDGAYWDRSTWTDVVALLAEARSLIGVTP